jgi:ketol-acid reductoisomerase
VDIKLTKLQPGKIKPNTGVNTAEYGETITDRASSTPMKRVLADIQFGRFARDRMLENKVNQTSFKATRAKLA